MKTIIILTIMLAFYALNVSAQVSEEWVKRYSGSGNQDDRAVDAVTDAAGNVYVTGWVYGLFGESNFYTAKYDAAGNSVWSRTYDGGALENDMAKSVAVDGSGNVFVTGSARLTDSTGLVFATIKYNSAGTQQWVRHTNVGNDSPMDMKIDAAGNVYVTGYLLYHPYGRVVTVKYNSAGTQQWLVTYNPVANSFYGGYFLEVDASGNVYIGGHQGSFDNGQIHLLKYNSSGAFQWVRTYSSGGTVGIGDMVNDMAIDASANIYLTGQVKGMSGSSGPDMVTLKYNSSGTLQWAQKFNGAANNSDIARCIGVDASGNVYAGGLTYVSTNNSDAALIKYNSAGTQQWLRTINGQGNSHDAANDLILDAAGNIFLTGQSTGLSTGYNYLTARYSPTGTQVWLQTYLGPGNEHDYANAIAPGTNGVVYVTGYSEGSGTGKDLATVKYAQTVGIQNINSEVPDKFSLEQNYPNPFNPVTKIGLRIADFGFVSLKIFDITGKEIAVLVNENMNAGTYNVDFDASHLASGMYFYRIAVHSDRMEANGFTDIKKMMLVK
ncbi:MAG TPA: T9SS type A sorting domain-containing protein [Ignavibacteria bacterium]|nr:T9SS type A sorting domain-containing protein [Ignavibacteria bacterium]